MQHYQYCQCCTRTDSPPLRKRKKRSTREYTACDCEPDGHNEGRNTQISGYINFFKQTFPDQEDLALFWAERTLMTLLTRYEQLAGRGLVTETKLTEYAQKLRTMIADHVKSQTELEGNVLAASTFRIRRLRTLKPLLQNFIIGTGRQNRSSTTHGVSHTI